MTNEIVQAVGSTQIPWERMINPAVDVISSIFAIAIPILARLLWQKGKAMALIIRVIEESANKIGSNNTSIIKQEVEKKSDEAGPAIANHIDKVVQDVTTKVEEEHK